MFAAQKSVRIFYATSIIWSIVSLILTDRITYKLLDSENIPQLVGMWFILCLAPALPALWIWIMESSPWRRGFLTPVLAVAAFGIALTLNHYRTSIISLTLISWAAIAYLNAWILRKTTKITDIHWKRTAPASKTQIIIDHRKNLRLLEDHAIAGFPSVMRARQHFIEFLPSIVLTLRDYGPIENQKELTSHTAHARLLMLEKFSCELAFLCAISYFERMCGPDFRYTKQYRSLVDHMVRIEAAPDEGPFKGLGAQAMRAVNDADLETVVKMLEKQRQVMAARNEKQEADSDTIVALTAIQLLSRSGLKPDEIDSDFSYSFTRMIKGAMNKLRQSFLRQMTEIDF